MNKIYKLLSAINDIRAIFNGRIFKRIFNKQVGRSARRFFK